MTLADNSGVVEVPPFSPIFGAFVLFSWALCLGIGIAYETHTLTSNPHLSLYYLLAITLSCGGVSYAMAYGILSINRDPTVIGTVYAICMLVGTGIGFCLTGGFSHLIGGVNFTDANYILGGVMSGVFLFVALFEGAVLAMVGYIHLRKAKP